MAKDFHDTRSGDSQNYVIPPDAKYVRGAQVIKSARWPIGRDTFYRMVRQGRITKRFPVPGGRPAFSVAEIDAVFDESAVRAAQT